MALFSGERITERENDARWDGAGAGASGPNSADFVLRLGGGDIHPGWRAPGLQMFPDKDSPGIRLGPADKDDIAVGSPVPAPLNTIQRQQLLPCPDVPEFDRLLAGTTRSGKPRSALFQRSRHTDPHCFRTWSWPPGGFRPH